MALTHGGQLQQVAQQYKIPANKWLDLSTGIAPLSYPIPEVPLTVWQNLPQQSNELLTAAKTYYQCEYLTVTNGSQAIIKALPQLWQQKNACSKHVYLPQYGYKEHAKAWQDAGYILHFYVDELPVMSNIELNSVLVIINPNNPTGKLFKQQTIIQYQQHLQEINGLLVVDEAFIDVISKAHSICSKIVNSDTLVFRSFGKFFGLAGIRIGFLVANQSWCNAFNEHLGPWQVNGPAQYIATHALSDKAWHERQKQMLRELRTKLEALLWQYLGPDLLKDIKGTDLFLTLSFNDQTELPLRAKNLYSLLCQQAIYVRLTDEKDKLRLGIATDEQQARLAQALKNLTSL